MDAREKWCLCARLAELLNCFSCASPHCHVQAGTWWWNPAANIHGERQRVKMKQSNIYLLCSKEGWIWNNDSSKHWALCWAPSKSLGGMVPKHSSILQLPRVICNYMIQINDYKPTQVMRKRKMHTYSVRNFHSLKLPIRKLECFFSP